MSLKIKANYGEGGAGLSTKNALHPAIADVIRGLIDDIAAGSGAAAPITSPDGVAAAGANPTKAEYDVVVTLVNEIKAALNAVPAPGSATVVKV